jgi:hypothetical protein
LKILIADPAADWSTRDVYNGLVGGLRQAGHEVIEFRSGRLLEVFGRALQLQAKAEKAKTKPTAADVAYLTSSFLVTWALRHEPDWTLVVSGMYFHPDALVLLKRAGCRTGVLLTESPYDFPKERVMAGLADVVWTNERTAVEPLREVQPNTFYLRHAYNPMVHRPETDWQHEDAPAHDVVFIGTGFQERVDLFRSASWDGIDLGLYGAWPLLGPRSHLRKFVRGGIIRNERAAEMYRRAKVNLNLFRTSMGFGRKVPRIVGSESLGPRAYELAATGAFFLSEPRAEIAETFGDLVPTFESGAELEEMVRRWLADDTGRRRVAAALPAAVRGHSWTERACEVVADLERAAAGRGSSDTLASTRAASTAALGDALGARDVAVV